MWWLLIALLLLSRKSGSVSASVNVNPVATPSGTTSVGAPVGAQVQTQLSINPPTTTGPFLRNPDIGTFGVVPGRITPTISLTDDPAINTAVGPPPVNTTSLTLQAPIVSPSNPLGSLVQMAPPPPEPLITPQFTEIAPGISIPTGSNDGIISTPVTMPTATSTATFLQTQGTTAQRMVQL
jgi:hypothetical protein